MSRYIDADALKEWLDEYLSVFKKYDKGTIKGFVDHATSIEEFLNDPMDAKAEYEREQGEWIFDPEILCSDIGVYSAGYRCSVCGKDYFKVDRMNYCPNCGARMKGADDE